MARALIILLLAAILCPGQVVSLDEPGRMFGSGFGINRSGLVLLLNPEGQDKALNPSARPHTPAVNLLLSSGDLTATWLTLGSPSIDDATHVTCTAQHDTVYQSVLTTASVNYTVYLLARAVSGNTELKIYHLNSATGGQTDVSVTNTLAPYSLTVAGKTGGGNVLFGIRDHNASGFGQIEVTRWMVAVGTHTAAEMAALYELTTDRQSIYDFSGNGNHGIPGGVAAPTTNDPTLSWESRNNCAPGSCKDLTDAAWTTTLSTVDSATLLTFDAQNGRITQSLASVSGASYTVSATIRRVTGNTAINLYHSGLVDPDTPITITDTATRYEATVVGDGGAINWGVLDDNAAGHGQIEITNWQVEIGTAASTFTDPAESGRPVMGFTTDDYVTADGVAASFTGEDKPFTVTALLSPSQFSAERWFSFGRAASANPFIELYWGASGVLVFSIRDDATTLITRTSTEAVSLKEWTILTVSSTGTVLSGWINGVPVTWNSTDVDVGTLTLDRATVGAFGRNVYGSYFEGDIAVIPIYNRALSPGEVTRLTHELARQACVQNGIAEMCSVTNRTAPAYGWNWGGDAGWWVGFVLDTVEQRTRRELQAKVEVTH